MHQNTINREVSRIRLAIVAILVISIVGIIGAYSRTTVIAKATSQNNSEAIESSPFQLVSTQPQANALDISPTSVISATFDEIVDATAVSTETFTVRGSLSGIYTGIYTVTGSTIEFKASDAFKAGELIVTTVTSGVLSAEGDWLEPRYTWEFFTSVGRITELGQGMFDGRILPVSAGFKEGIALGDLDNDGDLDAFEIVTTASECKVWLNDGFGNFIDSGQRLGQWSRGVSLGDLDGDGDLDAVVARTGSSTVYFNDGEGIFSDGGQDFGDVNHIGLALGDLDGDGDLDSFFATISGGAVWLNDGNGVFTISQWVGDLHSRKVSLGDVDADGDMDAFVTSANPPNKLWLNNGDGFFSDSGQDFNGRADEIGLGDVDNDGDMDAVTTNNDGHGVLFNNGFGVFTSGGQSLGGNDLALADLDGDGDLDVILANYEFHEDMVFQNDGTGSFSKTGQYLGNSDRSHDIALGDLDNDGDVDAFALKGYDDANQVYINRNQLLEHSFLPYIGDSTCRDYLDDFHDNTSGWPEINDPFVMAGYWNDMYLVHTKQSGYIYLFEAPDCLHHQYAVEARIRWSEVDLQGSSYGLIFGITGDYDSYYLYDINTYYRQFRLLRRDPSGFSVIVPITYDSAVWGSTSRNHLRAYMLGDKIGLEINGETLGVWRVPEFVGPTGSGIASAPYIDYPNSRALFDDFRVINIETTPPTAGQLRLEQDSRLDYSKDSRPVDLDIPLWQSNALQADMLGE